jgi:hypothetical protein
MRPREVVISIFQLGYSGCESAGAILRGPNDRRRFPLQGNEKGPGGCQTLGCQRGCSSWLLRVLSSHLSGPAARTRPGLLEIRMRIQGVPARACPDVSGQRCCLRAAAYRCHGATNLSGRVEWCKHLHDFVPESSASADWCLPAITIRAAPRSRATRSAMRLGSH